MYQLITIIGDKGVAEDVVEIASKAGSTGGTIINGRGLGVHETSQWFSMNIEPEKEIVLIISKTNLVENIVNTISKELKIDEPGNGIIFTQDIDRTFGLFVDED